MNTGGDPSGAYESPTDPFGGRYRDTGSASYSFGGGGTPQVSGTLVAIGHLLGWLASVVPLLLLALISATYPAVEYGWTQPDDAPSFAISALVTAAMFVVALVTGGIGRSRVRALKPAVGVVWFVVAAAVLVGGAAWLVGAHGIPL
ncbi:hypothetical protein [Ruania alba]|uniref:Uncharacterized protein n=1 Tax=Ruania alba TaxID=648782 RepID=A0A1H5NGA0_9MICO|nr:hypothetical protein [Ruania alba]SEF00585.1 hypothetical protein SAMN04488554_4308 [Ruania alba]